MARFTTRSRKGCVKCKNSKVKCDEQKPSCARCSKRGTLCVYPFPMNFEKTMFADNVKKIGEESNNAAVRDTDFVTEHVKMEHLTFTTPIVFDNEEDIKTAANLALNVAEMKKNNIIEPTDEDLAPQSKDSKDIQTSESRKRVNSRLKGLVSANFGKSMVDDDFDNLIPHKM